VVERAQKQVKPKGPVVRLTVGASLQRKCACGTHANGAGECDECKKQAGTLQRQASTSGPLPEVPAIVRDVLRSPGQPLDGVTREFMATRLDQNFSRVPMQSQAKLAVGPPGDTYEREADAAVNRMTASAVRSTPLCDFTNVRVHTDEKAAQSARAVNALAYTVGNHIVFGAGQYAPARAEGRRLLAHELTHVIQQGGSNSNTLQRAETDTSKNCQPLTDTKSDVNTRINKSLTDARKTAGTPPNADQVIDGVAKDLATNTSVGRSAIEDWAAKLGAKKVDLPKQTATKYAGVTFGIWSQPFFPILNPTMKVNGICIGSDKLGHFIELGFTYYRIARRTKGQKASDAERFGESTEGGGFGLDTTGVFSNADLEANRQGLKFYDDVKANPSLTFDISTYISNKWNEESNPNFYESSVGEQVWSNLLTRVWTGAFDMAGKSAKNVAVTLKATTAAVVTGTYDYVGDSGPIKGKISNGKISFGTTTVKTPTTATAKPVSGVTIDFEWSEGAGKGHGQWKSTDESHLVGTWGTGSSATNGGSWNIS